MGDAMHFIQFPALEQHISNVLMLVDASWVFEASQVSSLITPSLFLLEGVIILISVLPLSYIFPLFNHLFMYLQIIYCLVLNLCK